MNNKFNLVIFGALLLLAGIIFFFGAIVIETADVLINDAIGTNDAVETGLPSANISKSVSWIGFMSNISDEQVKRISVGQPTILSAQGNLITISVPVFCSVPTGDYPVLRVLFQNQAGITVRTSDYSPESYRHGQRLTSESVRMIVRVHSGESKLAVQVMG